MIGFEPGDLVGQTEGDEAVQIKITEVGSDQLRATVVKLGRFFSAARLTGGLHGTDDHGFVLGETLTFGFSKGTWVLIHPHTRPWHLLSVKQGVKTFEHYR